MSQSTAPHRFTEGVRDFFLTLKDVARTINFNVLWNGVTYDPPKVPPSVEEPSRLATLLGPFQTGKETTQKKDL